MHIQTKELLFQECMAQREGLELGKKLSSAQLPILNQVLGCARLLTQSMMTPELAGGKRHAQGLCVKAQGSPSERNRRPYMLSHIPSPRFALFLLNLLDESFLHTLQKQD